MSRPRAIIDLRTGTRLILSYTSNQDTTQAQAQTESEGPSPEETQTEINSLLARLNTHLINNKLTLSDLPPIYLSLSSLLQFSSPSITLFQSTLNKLQTAQKEWEIENPIPAAQERELFLYVEFFNSAFSVGSEVKKEKERRNWGEIERQVNTLNEYLRENKIFAERIRKTGIEELCRKLLRIFGVWDRDGVFTFSPSGDYGDGRGEDKKIAERVWGRVDMIGSGLSYLLKVDDGITKSNGKVGNTDQNQNQNQRPTTRSIFLLKSAPPATFSFASSKNEWFERKLIIMRTHLEDSVLDESNPIKREDEARWNVVYRDLEGLEDFFQRDGRGIAIENIKTSKIDETIRRMSDRLEVLHQESKVGEDETQFALMHISWELITRIGKSFAAMES